MTKRIDDASKTRPWTAAIESVEYYSIYLDKWFASYDEFLRLVPRRPVGKPLDE